MFTSWILLFHIDTYELDTEISEFLQTVGLKEGKFHLKIYFILYLIFHPDSQLQLIISND